MINLIKMDFYRMIHRKKTYIVLILAVAFATFSMIMSKVERVDDLDSSNKVQIEEDSVMMNFGIFVNTPQAKDGKEPNLIDYVQADLQSGMYMIFISFFAGAFVYEERKCGFIKNIGRMQKRKCMTMISKICTVVAFVLGLQLCYGGTQIILGKFFYPAAKLGITVEALKYIGIQLLLLCAFAVLIIFVGTLFKQSDFSVAFGVLLALGIGYLFTTAINKGIAINGFDVNRYLIVGTINRLSACSSGDAILRAFYVGISWFVVWSGLTILITERRDVI